MNQGEPMKDEAYELHAQVCRSLSSPVRLKVLDLLRNGEKSVKDLVSLTHVSQPNLSIHLKFLWETGVLERRQEGTTVYYGVAQPEIYDVIDIFRKINTKKLNRQHQLTRRRVRR
jgi:ArsR family transcriptional regulator